MEKKTLLQSLAGLCFAVLLLTAFTGRFATTHPFVEQLKTQLLRYSKQQAAEKVYLQLDRNFYQPNDFVWFSAWIRDADRLRADSVSGKLYVELIDPKGTVLHKQNLNAVAGLANGNFHLKDAVGGIYKIKAYTNWQKNSDAFFERDIQVQKVVLPNLKMKLDFEKKAYGAGDEVVAKLEAKDLEDQGLRLRDFTYHVSLDGKVIASNKATFDFDGKLDLRFLLPDKLHSRDGLLQILIPHNGQTESISRAIPITLKDIDLQFFPEGGTLVAGLPAKVAFKALNEFGKAADVAGVILNKNGEQVATFESFHMGMGATKLWPERGNSYSAKITKPEGITKVYELPEVILRGLHLGVNQQTDKAISLAVQASRPQTFHLVAQANNQILFSKSGIINGTENITFPTVDFPMGISKIALFDEAGDIACERLVFINPHKKLDINIKSNKEKYLPREEVQLDIEVKDHLGNPVQGNFALSVADDKLLTFADDKQGQILAKLFLESELKGEIEEPNFYFDEKENKAITALDFLMMTQGWRRYDWKEIRQNEAMAFPHHLERTRVAGRVVDACNQALAGAEVSIIGKDISTKTNAQGYFFIDNLVIEEVGEVMKVSFKGLPMVRKSIVDYKSDYLIVLAEGYGSVSGLLLDPNDRPEAHASVSVYNDNGNVWHSRTDNNGEYTLKNLRGGSYTLHFNSVRYIPYQIQKVMIWPSEDLVLSRQFVPRGTDIKAKNACLAERQEQMAAKETEAQINELLKQKKTEKIADDKRVQEEVMAQYNKITGGGNGAVSLDEVVVIEYKVPLVEQDNTTQGASLSASDIRNFASKSITSVAAATAGLSQLDENDFITVRGSRSDATDVYVDGIRISASQVQSMDVEMIQVLTGGLPAYYGGGVGAALPVRDYVGMPKSNKYESWENDRNVAPLSGSDFTLASGGGGSGGWSDFSTYRSPYERYHKKSRKVKVPAHIHSVVDQQAYPKILSCNWLRSEKDCYDCAHEKLMEQLLDAVSKSYNWNTYGGDILIEFFIDKDGKTGGLQLNNAGLLHNALNELYTLFSKMKDWEPARINNKKVAAKIIIPLSNEDMVTRRKTIFTRSPQFYAPRYVSDVPVLQRNDFRSTVFWKSDVHTNEQGKASITFCNSDDITSLKVTMEGLADNGSAGAGSHTYTVQMPFSMSAKMPVVLLDGDEVQVPITLINNTAESLQGEFQMDVPACLQLLDNKQLYHTLSAGEAKTIFPTFKVVSKLGSQNLQKGNIRFAFTAGTFVDVFDQRIDFQSEGYPVTEVFSGVEYNNTFTLNIAKLRKTTLKSSLQVHLNTIEEVMATCDRMLRQPGGCFEQTSSSNYPNVLVMQYIKQHRSKFDEAIFKKANEMMDSGYKRLLGFEVRDGGYEWYGRDPAHDGLTAYGILQFVDMQKVYPVSEEMLNRTVKWMLKRKDNQGGWRQNETHLHSWAPSPEIRNAYINWALTEAGFSESIKAEIESSYKAAKESDDPYLIALVANVLLEEGDQRGETLVGKLLKSQQPDGLWHGRNYSITHSQGINLNLETTALAVMALLDSDQEAADNATELGVNAIAKNKTATGFGSTQSTILCIKALLNYAEQQPVAPHNGSIALYIDEQLIQQLPYDSNNKTTSIQFNDFSQHLKEGSQKLEVRFAESGKPIPFEIIVDYFAATPKNNTSTCKLQLETKLANDKVRQGETTRLSTTLRNATGEVITSPIAIVGIPSGLSPQPWQLKALQEEQTIAHYEVMHNKVVFYLTELAAGEVKNIHLDLKADIPGKYQSPASNAYLYYENDVMAWVPPTLVEILR